MSIVRLSVKIEVYFVSVMLFKKSNQTQLFNSCDTTKPKSYKEKVYEFLIL